MTEKEQKLLNDSLSKLYKIDPEKLASLYNDAGELTDLSVVIEADAERIKKITDDKADQYKRGVKEGAQKIEKDIKEKYEVDSDLLGIDLVDHVIVSKIEEAKSSESIEKNPEFLKARADWEKEQRQRDKDWQKKLDNMQVEFDRAKVFDHVQSKALSLLAEANPILPADPRKAEQWKQIFVNDLKEGNYQLHTDGSIIVLDKDNNPLKDAHGYGKAFNEHAKDVMDKYFEFQKADDRSSPGNQQHAGGGGSDFNAPRDEDERLRMLQAEGITAAQRKQLTEYVIKK